MATTATNEDLIRIWRRYYEGAIVLRRIVQGGMPSVNALTAITDTVADIPLLLIEIRRLKEKCKEEIPSGAF